MNILMTTDEMEELFRLGLYNICSALHGSLHGLSDPLTDEIHDKYSWYLQYRLDTWRPGLEAIKAYDAAMRALVSATIHEIKFPTRAK